MLFKCNPILVVYILRHATLFADKMNPILFQAVCADAHTGSLISVFFLLAHRISNIYAICCSNTLEYYQNIWFHGSKLRNKRKFRTPAEYCIFVCVFCFSVFF